MSGRVARFVGVYPATLLAAWLLAGLPLLLGGLLHPAPTIALAAVIAAPATVMLVRLDVPQPRATVPLVLTLVIAAGFGVIAWTTSSEHVVVRRDPGVYAQTADWLAKHGRLPIPAHADAFGNTPGGSYGSPGFYQRGGPPAVVPQFMTGTPLALTPAGWAGGLRGITRADAVLGALALLAVAGLAMRLAGPWAAPLAALALGLAYPDLHQARSAFSEPAAQLLLFGGLALLIDAGRAVPGRIATAAHGVAGLLAGLVLLVRIDALIDLVPFVPVLAVMVVTGRRRDAVATGSGLALGIGVGLLDGFVVSRPYVDTLTHELGESVAAAIALVVVTLLVTAFRDRFRALPATLRRYWPDIAAIAVVVIAAGAWFIRPYVMHPHYTSANPVGRDVADLQRQLGLHYAQPRTYAEHSMQWLSWWLGPSGLVICVIGVALLLRHALRKSAAGALSFVLILLGTAVVVLAQPSITPDHPWADRRFVPVVLPGLVIAGAWLVVEATRWVRARWTARWAGAVATGGATALVLPALFASLPLLGLSTERGEIGAVHQVCRALPAHAAVLVTGDRARDEWPQVIRIDCGVPVALAPARDAKPFITAAAAAARQHGFDPVVMSDARVTASNAGGTNVRNVVHLLTREADHQLVRRPDERRNLLIDVWLADPP